MSASKVRRRKSPAKRETKTRNLNMSRSFGAAQQARHERCHALPAFRLRQKLFAAAPCQRVVLRPSVVVGDSPFRGDPAALFEAQESRIKRALVELQKVGGHLLNAYGNAVAMQRPEGFESLQHDQIQGALQHFAARLRHCGSPFDNLQEASLAPVDCQQVSSCRRMDDELVSPSPADSLAPRWPASSRVQNCSTLEFPDEIR